ncbi:MAG: hypothetical protein [Bacteriophage sp.]|nr:MAG: hypothetical protein [Bacteriophage sp.]
MKILDACCGSKMFWYNKHEPHTTYIDNRSEKDQVKSLFWETEEVALDGQFSSKGAN